MAYLVHIFSGSKISQRTRNSSSVWWLAKDKLQNCETGCFTTPQFLYINYLPFASELLDPIVLADDTNLFYLNKDINTTFLKVNNELKKIDEWFISIKLSLNVKKPNTCFSTNLAKKKIFH